MRHKNSAVACGTQQRGPAGVRFAGVHKANLRVTIFASQFGCECDVLKCGPPCALVQ